MPKPKYPDRPRTYVPVSVDRRKIRHRAPLSDEARAWLDELARDPVCVERWVRWALPPALVRVAGIGVCVAEAWLLLLDSARIYRGDMGCTRKSFAMTALQRFLGPHVRRTLPPRTVWTPMPTSQDGWQPADDLADHRPLERDPLLAAWCDDDAVRQRRCLDWVARVVLYLRYVERLTLDEVARIYGVTRQRAQQIESRAVTRLHERRIDRDRVA